MNEIKSRLSELTPSQLALLQKRLLEKQAQADSPITWIEKRPADETCPLSFAQERVWFFDQLEAGSPLYNIPFAFEMEGNLDINCLQQALFTIVGRHEALRTTFHLGKEGPVQQVNPAAIFEFVTLDLTNASPEEREETVEEAISFEQHCGFRLKSQCMLRAKLLRLQVGKYLFIGSMHHIASDDASLQLFYRELMTAYQAHHLGLAPSLPALPIQYGDYSVWQKKRAQTSDLKGQLDYWKNLLRDARTVLDLPKDRPRSLKSNYRGATLSFSIPVPLLEGLKAVSHLHGTTLFMTLFAGFSALLFRYTGQEDMLIGIPITHRPPGTENLIGFFVNTLPLRARAVGTQSFSDYLKATRETVLGAFANQEVPFETLVEEIKPERESNLTPLVQVMFALQQPDETHLTLPQITVTPTPLPPKTAKFDLTMVLRETSCGLNGSVEFDCDLFDDSRIQRMVTHFETLLQGLARDTSLALSELPLLPQEELDRVVTDWNQTASSYPNQSAIPELFERQVQASPESTAALYGVNSITYQELNKRANQLAHFLLKQGVAKDVLIPVCMDRSVDFLVTILGILKAGGAYVPLDPSTPRERILNMVQDVSIPLVLTQEHLLTTLFDPPPFKMICIDRDWYLMEVESEENPGIAISADHLAYVIYTSGSTGMPKGICIPHRGIIRLLFNTNYVCLGPETRMAQVSNISFDAATFEIWGALLFGGQLVGIPPRVLLDPPLFIEAMARYTISTLFLTTALFNQIAHGHPHAFSTLDTLLFGGEAADPDSVRLVLAGSPPRRLLNVYGPTESTTFTTFYEIKEVAENAAGVPIGHPISNTTLYILDSSLKPVPIGIPGELHIGGDGLACEYYKNKELTLQKFIPNPFSQLPGARLYKTGDLVRYLEGGEVEFLSRLDQQVKIRGFRIELGEVETHIKQLDTVQDCVVVAHSEEYGQKRLVAYVVTRPGASLGSSEIRQFLVRKLPDYMIPSCFCLVPAIPLNANGKVDRKALPLPEKVIQLGRKEHIPPRNNYELELSKIWEHLLKVEGIGVTDNFFEMGGNSLLAVRLFGEIEMAFDKTFPLAILFQAPTIADLAGIFSRQTSAPQGSCVVKIRGGSRKPIFWIHTLGGGGGGGLFTYRTLSEKLGEDQPSYGIIAPATPHCSIEEMAGAYIEELLMFQANPPYHLGGYCFGGVVAFEMARQLVARGKRVQNLFLIDSTPPNIKTRLPLRSPDGLLQVLQQPIAWAKGKSLKSIARAGFLKVKKLGQLARHKYSGTSATPQIPALDEVIDFSQYPEDFRKIALTHWQGLLRYQPQPYTGEAVLFRAKQRPLFRDPSLGWANLVKNKMTIEVIPGTHENMLEEPFVNGLAQKILQHMKGDGAE